MSPLLEGYDPLLPDAGGGVCCMGSVVYGPGRCTCWEEVVEPKQQPEQPGPSTERPGGMCASCAYRGDSPERTGQQGAAHDADDLADLAAGDLPFYCHEGMPLVVQMRHPSGAVYTPPPLAYRPAMGANGAPLKADGTPAHVCAGWAACRRHMLNDSR